MRRHETLAAVALAALLSGSVGAATTTGAAKSTSAAKTPAMVMPWIEDDYAKAISEAKARKLPVFVESWAPW